jgi:hypothetical protein
MLQNWVCFGFVLDANLSSVYRINKTASRWCHIHYARNLPQNRWVCFSKKVFFAGPPPLEEPSSRPKPSPTEPSLRDATTLCPGRKRGHVVSAAAIWVRFWLRFLRNTSRRAQNWVRLVILSAFGISHRRKRPRRVPVAILPPAAPYPPPSSTAQGFLARWTASPSSPPTL